jgi:L-ascorbate oxidase
MGMQSVWVFGDYDDIVAIPQPYAMGYLEYGGSSYGNSSFTPSYVHSWSD